MEHLQRIWKFIKPVVRNKYILSLLVFVLWVGIFDSYNLVNRIQDVNKLRELQEERNFFQEEIRKYRKQMQQLDSSTEMLEKFAREQHLMKAPNEDVFIIMDKE
ncbi:MAG: FtsB family cell division protein [Bacteroidales bacterium]